MNKSKVNYWVDIVMGIAFLLVFITGVIKFPELTQHFTGIYRVFSAYKINKLHDWSGLIMGILVFIHLALHWNWLVAMTKNMFKMENTK